MIEKDSGPPMVLSFSDDKNVTDEYEYVYIPREMSKKEVEGRFEVEKQCPMCGTVTSIYLTDEDMDKYSWYSNSRFNRRGSGLPAPHIQNLFPDRTEEERELMMSGYCYWCQELIDLQNPPKDYTDLVNPEWKDKYTILNFGGGTGKTILASLLVRYRDDNGEYGISDEGWDFVKSWIQNGHMEVQGEDYVGNAIGRTNGFNEVAEAHENWLIDHRLPLPPLHHLLPVRHLRLKRLLP